MKHDMMSYNGIRVSGLSRYPSGGHSFTSEYERLRSANQELIDDNKRLNEILTQINDIIPGDLSTLKHDIETVTLCNKILEIIDE